MIGKSKPDQVKSTTRSSAAPREKPLQSWKEIAAYLERDERTARRWEKRAGLPVRRHHDGPRSTVYAYPSELESWRSSRKPKASQTAIRRWSFPAALGFFAIFLVIWFIFYGPVLNPPNPLVEAAGGITLRQVWSDRGVDDCGNVSLDGRFLTYTDWDTGDLAIRDLEKEETRRLTDKGLWTESDEFAEFSLISPDGNKIAYSWYNMEGKYDLRIVEFDLNEPQVLYSCNGEEWVKPIGWLPDGKKILTACFTNALLTRVSLVSVPTREVDLVASEIWRASDISMGLSPDGKDIVYDDLSEEGTEQRDIFLLPINGGSAVKLVDHPSDDYRPVWSPDGRLILFVSDRMGNSGLWALPVAEGRPLSGPTLVKSDLGPIHNVLGCTRKGDYLYSLSAGMEDVYLFEMNPSNGEIIKEPFKLAGRYAGANMGPVFSPDGKYLAYHFQHSSQLINPGALVLIVRSLATGDEKEIRTRFIQYGPVQWFPDGKSLLVPVMRNRRERDQFDYYQIDLGTGQAELIRQSRPTKFASYRPCLSPDGKSIYFTESEVDGPRQGLTEIREFDIESGCEDVVHQLPEGKRAVSVQLSPDGRNLAWAEWGKTQGVSRWGVMTRPVDGDARRELLKLDRPEYLSAAGSIAWAPDGQHILVSKFTGPGRHTEVLRLSVTGDKPQSLGVGMDRILFGDVHKNGRLVAFYAGQQKGRAREIWALSDFMPEQ